MKDDHPTAGTASSILEQGGSFPDTIRFPSTPFATFEDALFAAPPMPTSVLNDPILTAPDPAVVKSGDDSGMTRFCEEAFISPESAKAGSQTLIASFDDSGLWLASLVQPPHLVAELRQQTCMLTRVVVTQWTRQGETHKLVRLAEALMEAEPPVLSHEAGQIMALLAGLLGILRPAMAPRWLAACRPLLRDSLDPHLLKDAALWVGIGQMLAPLPPEDRLFWNRRLRDPRDDWDWDCPEALDALRRLAPLLPGDADAMLLFQTTLPRCWWELWRDQQFAPAAASQEPVSSAAASPPPAPRAPVPAAFFLGLGTGILCMMLVGWWASSRLAVAPSTLTVAEEESQPPAPAAAAADFSFHAVNGSTPPPSAGPAPVKPPSVKPAPAAKRSAASKAAPRKAPDPALSPAMQARMNETALINKEMPELARLHKLVKAGSVSDSMPYLQGTAPMITQSSKEHRALLRWLMLDPPLDAQVRVQVAKAALRILSAKEMYEALMYCLHPGSPNLPEARESASLLLALSSDNLTTSQIQSLTQAAELK